MPSAGRWPTESEERHADELYDAWKDKEAGWELREKKRSRKEDPEREARQDEVR